MRRSGARTKERATAAPKLRVATAAIVSPLRRRLKHRRIEEKCADFGGVEESGVATKERRNGVPARVMIVVAGIDRCWGNRR
jgi:predicted nucleotidyltransferase